jgi:flagellar hook-associated protein 2
LQYLSITHGTGAANIFSVSRSDGSNPTPTDGLQATAGSATSAGVDASISYNGITFTSPTNTFSNFVSDLNITISSSAPVASPTSTPPVSATTVHLTTTDNTSGCQQALSDIVSSYNSLLKTLQTQMTWNSDVTKRGGLANDPIANGLLDQMRLLSTNPITLANGKTVTMADVGVRTNTDGSLEVDTQSLNTAMTNNPGLLESVISSGTSAGALERFSSVCTVITAPTSDLQTLSNTTTNTDLAKIADDETALTTAMTALQAKYLQQFSDMQTIVSSAKSTQDSLTQSMTAWTAGLKS